MKLEGKVAVVTGAARGIGRALSIRFAAEKALGVVVADQDYSDAAGVADQIGGLAVKADVSVEWDVIRLVEQAREKFGRIDMLWANAGISGKAGGIEVANEDWQKIWDVNVMAHIYAARAVLPEMLARGDGYLLSTASAAGLLTTIGAAPYSVTKHAALAFSEWLAITYGDSGIKVSCLCPQGVKSRMLDESLSGAGPILREGAIEPEEVADAVVKGLADETFLILPHPEVREYFLRKATDYDRWIRGMRRLKRSIEG